MFVSHRPNLDPAPARDTVTGERRAFNEAPWGGLNTGPDWVLDPRPEYDHTRDPYPWLEEDGERVAHSGEEEFGTEEGSGSREWAPRHDQYDTPVNPILAAFRADPHYSTADRARDYLLYLVQYPGVASKRYSLEEIDHARRVLSKLVALSEKGA